MANPTTNFGWVMPTSTSLVTNLPADFNTFGQGVDTSMAQLKGGTTGQILSKTSATDMAFTWITPNPGDITGVTAGTGISGGGTSGDVTITNSMATAMTTKGDLVPATGSGTFSRLAIGTNGQVLTADSTAATGMKWNTSLASPLTTKGDIWTYSTTDARLAVGTNGQTLVADSTASTGLKWATPAAGGTDNFSLLNSGGTALSGSSTSVTGISGMNTLYILVANASSTSSSSFISVQFNTDTTAANYDVYGWYLITTPVGESNRGAGEFPIGRMANNAASVVSGGVLLQGCNSSGKKLGYMSGAGSVGGGANNMIQNYWGQYSSSSTISSVQIKTSGGTFDDGTVYIYGSA